MTSFSEFHAHIYFGSGTKDKAKDLMNNITDNFSLEVGTFHEKPVGPHPCWSFQVKFDTKMFGIFVPWLMETVIGLQYSFMPAPAITCLIIQKMYVGLATCTNLILRYFVNVQLFFLLFFFSVWKKVKAYL